MKWIQWILGVIAALALIFALLITSFEVAAYSDFGWYEKEYRKYNVMPDLTMEMDDIMKVTHEMMDYLRGDRENLVVYTTINEETNQEFFNEQDKIHMADVRNLFVGGMDLRLLALAVMTASLVVLLFSKVRWKYLLPRCFQIGLGLAGVLTVIIAVYAAVDFDSFFTLFHELLFTNDLWMFDPSTDYMIRMLTEGFFMDMALRIGMIFAACLLVLLILSIISDKISKKENETISEVRG